MSKLAPKFAGRTLLFLGKQDHLAESLLRMVELEGGTLVEKLSKKLDIIVDLPKVESDHADVLKQAQTWNKKGEAAIEILKYQDFQDRFQLTPDDALVLLRGGEDDRKRLDALLSARHWSAPELLISAENLQGLAWSTQSARKVILEDCDLSNADLAHSTLRYIRGCKFDGAKLEGIGLSGCDTSSFVGADLCRAMLGNSRECDLSGADMQEFRGSQLSLEQCVLEGANLTRANLSGARLGGSNFSGAILEGADLAEANLMNANLSQANFAKASLEFAVLKGADVRGANFKDAVLSNTDFEGAQIEGADFTGARTAGAKFGNLELTKAIGLETPKPLEAKAKLKALGAAAKGAERIQTSVEVNLANGTHVKAEIDSRQGQTQLQINRTHKDGGAFGNYENAMTLEAAVLKVVANAGHGTLRVESITTKSQKSALSGKALKALIVEAWCEAFDLPIGDGHEAAAEVKRKSQERADNWREILRAGPSGVQRWNQAARHERPPHLRGAKLAGAVLAGLDAHKADLSKADLSGAVLAAADLSYAKLGRAKLDAATLARSDLSHAQLGGASLVKADLTEANLANADLRGADLTGAVLSLAVVDDAGYDETTVFPAGFAATPGLKWKGKGRPPKLEETTTAEAIDISTFIKRLEKHTEKARWSKALNMLKKERFQLFSDIADDRIVGVVKSQNDPTLVYACSLAESGSFSCCTQNLNVCGGLRGALCKHLLVLVVGLTQADKLDPTRIDGWVNESRRGGPELDRDKMSEIFLRYKGAESGEVDWRPVETLPEDYYAF